MHAERALRLLEQPVPATLVRLVGLYARQVVRQAAHRLWPSRFAGRSRQPVAMLRLASAANDADSSRLLLFFAGRPLGVYFYLRTLNLAEEAGPCPELARSYATMCIASSLIPLHRLAKGLRSPGLGDRRGHRRPGDPHLRGGAARGLLAEHRELEGVPREAGRGRRNQPAHRRLEAMGGECGRAPPLRISPGRFRGAWIASGNSGG